MLSREIMVKPVVTRTENSTVAEIAQVMSEQGIGCVPITNEVGALTGLITASDFVRKELGLPFSKFRVPQLFGYSLPTERVKSVYAEAKTRLAKEIMTRNVVTVTEDDPIEAVLRLMLERDLKRLPVVRRRVPIGIVTRNDLLGLLNARKVAVYTRTARVPGIY